MGNNFITTIQIAGLVFSIPFEVAAGPLLGYFLGAFLNKKYGMPEFFIYVLILLGLAASIMNAVLIIKMMLRISEKNKGRDA